MQGSYALGAYHPGELEAAYCKRQAAALSQFCVLDRELIVYGGGNSRVELCDLLSNDGDFVHVKRYEGSSAPLSHLAGQALVSAQALMSDEEFRARALEKVPPKWKQFAANTRPEQGKFRIVFAVISRSAQPIALSLPFFSRLTLSFAAKQLRGFGYRVLLTKIPISAKLSA
jgi:uncharacterized protein (TIGR04141 family)